MLKFIILIIFSTQLHSQELYNMLNPLEDETLFIDEQDIENEEVPLSEDELENLSELRETQLNSVNKILNSKFNKYDKVQKEVVKIKTEDILKSKTFRGYINKDTILYNLINKKQEVLTQNSYVNAYSLLDQEGYHYLQNENGSVTYKVRSADIAHIERVSNLHEPPKYFRPVLTKEVFDFKDKSLRIKPHFNYQIGRTRPNFMRDLTNDPNHTGSLTRLELRTLGDFKLPINIGLSVLYTDIKAQIGTGGENYNQSSLAFGPVIEFAHLLEDSIDINITMGFHSTVYSQLKEVRVNETLDYSLTQSMFTTGLEKEFSMGFGIFSAGVNFQRQWSKASSQEFNIDVKTDRNYDDSFAFLMGWGVTWDIY